MQPKVDGSWACFRTRALRTSSVPPVPCDTPENRIVQDPCMSQYELHLRHKDPFKYVSGDKGKASWYVCI